MENSSISGSVLGRVGPLFVSERYFHTKDPCPVFDGRFWHIFGSGSCRKTGELKILHATSLRLEGPWKEESSAVLQGISGREIAAPGVVYDFKDKLFHMFIQTEFSHAGGRIEHLVSCDGYLFQYKDTSFRGVTGTPEACVYDPHPAFIRGERYLTYSASFSVGRPDIYLLKSLGNWNGPWEKMGVILSHHEISHHNQHEQNNYEWGLEGSQLVSISDKIVLLNAVCFLPKGRFGTRQRVFFAFSKNVSGPYKSSGPILNPFGSGWEDGENGHAAAVTEGDTLHLFYQSRSSQEGKDIWTYGKATFFLKTLESIGKSLHTPFQK